MNGEKGSETVTISKAEYMELKDDAAHLNVLDTMGVDNWQGYVGRYNDCKECGKYDISWAESECPKCGEVLPEPIDLM